MSLGRGPGIPGEWYARLGETVRGERLDSPESNVGPYIGDCIREYPRVGDIVELESPAADSGLGNGSWPEDIRLDGYDPLLELYCIDDVGVKSGEVT